MTTHTNLTQPFASLITSVLPRMASPDIPLCSGLISNQLLKKCDALPY